ncbi:MAG: arsenate reductase (glutaredoxin) [Arcobacteraceae bacterium]|nr:arsenate reductase (glutaredoxin) [Arcobacteraceae bacterium]
MLIIWHNPKCSKSRECIKVLDEKDIDFIIREYLVGSPSKLELEELISIMNILDIRDMMRTKESKYKELDLANQDKISEDLVDAMVRFPKLIERPIGINSGVARVGRPLENILDII